jgi:hypothetical protein
VRNENKKTKEREGPGEEGEHGWEETAGGVRFGKTGQQRDREVRGERARIEREECLEMVLGLVQRGWRDGEMMNEAEAKKKLVEEWEGWKEEKARMGKMIYVEKMVSSTVASSLWQLWQREKGGEGGEGGGGGGRERSWRNGERE